LGRRLALDAELAAVGYGVRAGAGVPVPGDGLDVVLQRVAVACVGAEVAHDVPAAGGGQPHGLPAGYA